MNKYDLEIIGFCALIFSIAVGAFWLNSVLMI